MQVQCLSLKKTCILSETIVRIGQILLRGDAWCNG